MLGGLTAPVGVLVPGLIPVTPGGVPAGPTPDAAAAAATAAAALGLIDANAA